MKAGLWGGALALLCLWILVVHVDAYTLGALSLRTTSHPFALLRQSPQAASSSSRVYPCKVTCCIPNDVLPRASPLPIELQPRPCRDAISCENQRVPFMRAAFGTHDDVDAELVRVMPYHADTDLRNEDMIHGKIALVMRGSEQGVKCTFVDKARRVAEAGAIGLIVVNNEDTLVSPGDSAREGTEIEFPVVGVRLSDADRLSDITLH